MPCISLTNRAIAYLYITVTLHTIIVSFTHASVQKQTYTVQRFPFFGTIIVHFTAAVNNNERNRHIVKGDC